MSFTTYKIQVNTQDPINTKIKMSSTDFNIPDASKVKEAVMATKAVNKKAKEEKQDALYKQHLNEISKKITEMVKSKEGFTKFEYFVDNGDMNGSIEDYDLCKGGAVIIMIADYLTSKGYYLQIEEGKFKQIHRYGTYITISVVPISDGDDDYYY
jgi:hypothetical protein